MLSSVSTTERTEMSAPATETAAPVGSVVESVAEVSVPHVEVEEKDPFSEEPPSSFSPPRVGKRGRNTGYAFPEKAILYNNTVFVRIDIPCCVATRVCQGIKDEKKNIFLTPSIEIGGIKFHKTRAIRISGADSADFGHVDLLSWQGSETEPQDHCGVC